MYALGTPVDVFLKPDPDGQLGQAHVEYLVEEIDARCEALEIDPVLECADPIVIACDAIDDDGDVNGVEFRLDP